MTDTDTRAQRQLLHGGVGGSLLHSLGSSDPPPTRPSPPSPTSRLPRPLSTQAEDRGGRDGAASKDTFDVDSFLLTSSVSFSVLLRLVFPSLPPYRSLSLPLSVASPVSPALPLPLSLDLLCLGRSVPLSDPLHSLLTSFLSPDSGLHFALPFYVGLNPTLCPSVFFDLPWTSPDLAFPFGLTFPGSLSLRRGQGPAAGPRTLDRQVVGQPVGLGSRGLKGGPGRTGRVRTVRPVWDPLGRGVCRGGQRWAGEDAESGTNARGACPHPRPWSERDNRA